MFTNNAKFPVLFSSSSRHIRTKSALLAYFFHNQPKYPSIFLFDLFLRNNNGDVFDGGFISWKCCNLTQGVLL